MWREGRLVAVLGPRTDQLEILLRGMVSPPYSPSPAFSFLAQTCTQVFLATKRGMGRARIPCIMVGRCFYFPTRGQTPELL